MVFADHINHYHLLPFTHLYITSKTIGQLKYVFYTPVNLYISTCIPMCKYL